MKYQITRPDGVLLTREIPWDNKVAIAAFEKRGWKKVEEKSAPKKAKSKSKGTKS